jgi:hypothetical protein
MFDFPEEFLKILKMTILNLMNQLKTIYKILSQVMKNKLSLAKL